MIQAERMVIGALLMDASALSKVRHMLSPEMFTDAELGRYYAEFLRGADEGREVNHTILMQRFGVTDNGADFVRQMLDICLRDTISSTQIGSAADAVLREYQASEFKKVVSSARASPANVREMLSETITKLHGIEVPDTRGQSVKSIAEETMGYYFRDRKVRYTRFGIPKVDEMIQNLEPGDITVVAARPAVGKSAFVIQTAANLSKQGRKVALFSLEMSREQVFERFLAHIGGLALDRVRFATRYTNDEESRHKRALEWLLKNENIIIFADGKGNSCPRDVSGMEAACQTEGVDVAIIDYLQLMTPERAYSGNRAAEVGEISSNAKRMAMRLGIHVISLCQLNRGSEYRTNRRPMLADLRDSGAIEQDASNVILLWNADANDRARKGCAVEKQRQGSTGETELYFDGQHMRFVSNEKEMEKARGGTPFDAI